MRCSPFRGFLFLSFAKRCRKCIFICSRRTETAFPIDKDQINILGKPVKLSQRQRVKIGAKSSNEIWSKLFFISPVIEGENISNFMNKKKYSLYFGLIKTFSRNRLQKKTIFKHFSREKRRSKIRKTQTLI